jgi:hypothetical protein
MKMISSERSRQLAQQNGWSLAFAQGNVDGELHRRLGKPLAPHARVGIDQYSLDFAPATSAGRPSMRAPGSPRPRFEMAQDTRKLAIPAVDRQTA